MKLHIQIVLISIIHKHFKSSITEKDRHEKIDSFLSQRVNNHEFIYWLLFTFWLFLLLVDLELTLTFTMNMD